jgi:hypothetical protein
VAIVVEPSQQQQAFLKHIQHPQNRQQHIDERHDRCSGIQQSIKSKDE